MVHRLSHPGTPEYEIFKATVRKGKEPQQKENEHEILKNILIILKRFGKKVQKQKQSGRNNKVDPKNHINNFVKS